MHVSKVVVLDMVKLVHGYRRYRGSWPLCVSHFLSIPRNSVVLFIAHLLEIIVLNRAFIHKYILESAYAFYMMDQNFGCSHDYILWGHLCLLLEKLALGCSQVLVQDQPSCTNRPSVTFSILMFSLRSRR